MNIYEAKEKIAKQQQLIEQLELGSSGLDILNDILELERELTLREE